jgi:hypothetical protein
VKNQVLFFDFIALAFSCPDAINTNADMRIEPINVKIGSAGN